MTPEPVLRLAPLILFGLFSSKLPRADVRPMLSIAVPVCIVRGVCFNIGGCRVKQAGLAEVLVRHLPMLFGGGRYRHLIFSAGGDFE